MKKLIACIQINKQSALSHPSLAHLILLGLPERERKGEKKGTEGKKKEREREKGGEREGERKAKERKKKKGIQNSIRH